MPRTWVPATFDDYRAMARARLPRQLFEYIDGGAHGELTLRANAADLDVLRLRQRVLRNVEQVDLRTTVLGREWPMPLGLAPVGLAGMMRRRGETQAVRAANAAGVTWCLSTVGLCSIEEVAGAASAPFWFQLYMMRDRGFVAELISRAKAARCEALVVTVDLAVPGLRFKDVRNGMTGGLSAAAKLAVNLERASRVRWIADVVLGGGPLVFGTLASKLPEARSLPEFHDFVRRNFDPTVSWQDIDWIRSQWDGPIVIKGVMDPEDARSAASAGAQAIVVSNHGGRQLDGAPSTIAALPAIADAVGDRVDVLVDGGIRGGLDVMKALACGARAALMGRAWVFALAAMGEAGVARLLEAARNELRVSLALAGIDAARKVDRNSLF
ncbi:L-lactate dehydrogenase [Quisquiliibacterium transsilvanicum]|uniref:L-lactate dehydrogenase (Cytochrome) n=1 Tax=Quisquiliibacterium transsilvanicum TaxID=1549638 RepID=A0A7W8HII6_9BURK|nr:L-lactate dehydrogenase [Quisquiliibacterium transsilvanicum]MBB5272016.1 L-lactate dehydrogenase (cytochrome) [Quisquiliibacterium transsilvanicum]